MNKEIRRVWYVQSDSNPNKKYTVQLNGKRIICSCKSFQYSCHTMDNMKSKDGTIDHRKFRFCKHCKLVKDKMKLVEVKL